MIHQYKNNGYNIVMDVNSGSVHVVDDCVYDVIPRIEECINKGVKEKDGILDALKAEGINKVSLIAFKSNTIGNKFWRKVGWTFRDDLNYYDFTLNEENITRFIE